jgi:hypothetical protein
MSKGHWQSSTLLLPSGEYERFAHLEISEQRVQDNAESLPDIAEFF